MPLAEPTCGKALRHGPKQVVSHGASPRHSPAARAPRKLPLRASLRNGPQENCFTRSQPAAQPYCMGPRKIASHGASLLHSPAARAPGKLPLTERHAVPAPGKLPLMKPACGAAQRHGPQANCLSRSQPAAQACGTGPRKIASHRVSLRHSLAARVEKNPQSPDLF